MLLKNSFFRTANIIALLTLFLALVGCGPVTETQQVSLAAGQYWSAPLALKSGDLVEGTFVVGGAADMDIGFSVKGPDANEIIRLQQYRSYNFTFRARQDGVHYLNLDNSYSLFASKVVSLTIKYPKR